MGDSTGNSIHDYINYLQGIGVGYIWVKRKREELLDGIAGEIRACSRCELYHSRKNPVPGHGNPYCRLMLIGEAPGEKEDEQGLPFVGPSGMRLNLWLERIGLKRKDVFITNIVKCRPPHNRNPKPEEMKKCMEYLERQIRIIRPCLIVTLGKIAASVLLGVESVVRMRGNLFHYEGIKVIPTYHPSYVLRNPKREQEVFEDLDVIKEILEECDGSDG